MSEIRFDHIALALPRMADAVPFLAGTLGGAPAFGADAGVYRFGQWRFANKARLEVLEPTGADGFLHRFLAARGPGIHHVTFKVPSLREACDRAKDHGYEIVGYRDVNPYWKEAFLHPRRALGVVVQLADSAPGGTGRTSARCDRGIAHERALTRARADSVAHDSPRAGARGAGRGADL